LIDNDHFLSTAQADRELRHKLRGVSAVVRFDLGEHRFDLHIADGVPSRVGPPESRGYLDLWTAGFLGIGLFHLPASRPG